ncbi:hypothetical protein V6N13_131407 [Hibiscus sabdariffa]
MVNRSSPFMEICWAFEGTTSVRKDSGQSRFSFTTHGNSVYWIIFKKRRCSKMNGGLVYTVAVMMVQISALKMCSVWSLYSDKNVRKYVGNPIAELTFYNIKIWCVYWSSWSLIHTNQGSASCKPIETPNFLGVLDICAALEKTKIRNRIPIVNFYGNLSPHDKDKQGDNKDGFYDAVYNFNPSLEVICNEKKIDSVSVPKVIEEEHKVIKQYQASNWVVAASNGSELAQLADDLCSDHPRTI